MHFGFYVFGFQAHSRGVHVSFSCYSDVSSVSLLSSGWLVFSGHGAPRVMFLLASPSPGCFASWPVWIRRTVAVACTKLVSMVTLHFMLCSPPWSASPGCSSSWPVWTRRTVSPLAVACARRVLTVTIHPALFTCLGSQAMTLGIMAAWTGRTVAGIAGFSCTSRCAPWFTGPRCLTSWTG